MKRSKAYRSRGGDDRQGQALRPARGRHARQGDQLDQEVRRDRRGRDASRRRPAQGRPDGPRHRQPAARHRQDRPGPGLRDRRQGRGGPRGRRRHRRRRRADRGGQGRHARLRRRRRDPGPDGQGRPPRPRARPARPDAEPEDRHRDHRRRARPSRTSRAARSSSASTATPTCTSSSARPRSARTSSWRTTPPRSTRCSGSSRPAAKGRYVKKVAVSTTMGPGIQVDPNRSRNVAATGRGLSRQRVTPTARLPAKGRRAVGVPAYAVAVVTSLTSDGSAAGVVQLRPQPPSSPRRSSRSVVAMCSTSPRRLPAVSPRAQGPRAPWLDHAGRCDGVVEPTTVDGHRRAHQRNSMQIQAP